MGQRRAERVAAAKAKAGRPEVAQGGGRKSSTAHLIRQAGRHTKSKRGRGKG